MARPLIQLTSGVETPDWSAVFGTVKTVPWRKPFAGAFWHGSFGCARGRFHRALTEAIHGLSASLALLRLAGQPFRRLFEIFRWAMDWMRRFPGSLLFFIGARAGAFASGRAKSAGAGDLPF
jgi:hypothetical protein